MQNPTPVSQEDVRVLLDIQDENQRIEYAKGLGIQNTNPPLPASPYVKNKKTGMILPWNELLAAQSDICECCDANGNTDPEVWGPLVAKSVVPNEDLHQQARDIIVAQAAKTTNEYRVPNAVNLKPASYPEGTVPYSELLDSKAVESLVALRSLA